jgi:predicted RNA-binding protein YlxR (DUF448 family)/ribosomal protein L7Ae-like RNA K-turn-binding protein
VHVQDVESASVTRGPRKEPTRTCAGCGRREAPEALVRVVVLDGELAVDLAGGSFGRGAHVHPSPGCLAKASAGGFARAFKSRVRADAAELAAQIAGAEDRRMAGLLLAARRARKIALGADAARAALAAHDDAWIVVATDAGTIASQPFVANAVRGGRAVAWGTKERLGSLLGGGEVAVAVVIDPRIGREMGSATRTAVAVTGGGS